MPLVSSGRARRRIWGTTGRSWKGDGAPNHGSLFQSCEEQKVIGSSHHGGTKTKSGLIRLRAFYKEMTGLVDRWRMVHVIYLRSKKPFYTVSCNTSIDNLMKYNLYISNIDQWTVRWIKNWLNVQPQSIVISGTKSSWRPVISGISWGSVLVLLLFNIFSNDLNDGAEYTFGRFVHYTKL